MAAITTQELMSAVTAQILLPPPRVTVLPDLCGATEGALFLGMKNWGKE